MSVPVALDRLADKLTCLRSASHPAGVNGNRVRVLWLGTGVACCEQFFVEHRVYDLMHTGSAADAASVIAENRVDVAVLDLHAFPANQRALSFIEKHGERVPLIVVTDETSCEVGFACHTAGAKALFNKAGLVGTQGIVRLVHAINYWALVSLIMPGIKRLDRSSVALLLDTLITKRPGSVSEWASDMGVTDRYVLTLCRQVFCAPPRSVLLKANSIGRLLGSALADLSCGSTHRSHIHDAVVRAEGRMVRAPMASHSVRR